MPLYINNTYQEKENKSSKTINLSLERTVEINNGMNPNLRVFSLQCGLFSPRHSSFTPESLRLLLLRSRSLRLEGLEHRAEAREEQLSFVIRQPDSLQTHNNNTQGTWWWCFAHTLGLSNTVSVSHAASADVSHVYKYLRRPTIRSCWFACGWTKNRVIT